MTPDLDHRLDLAGQIHAAARASRGAFRIPADPAAEGPPFDAYPHRELADKLVLFRTHFLLFNALYHLRDHLWAEREAHQPAEPAPASLRGWHAGAGTGDPLRDYYLDLRHLGETSEADVERLLQSFWTRMQGSEEKAAALALFELEGAVDYPAIKLRYRHWSASTIPTAAAALRACNRSTRRWKYCNAITAGREASICSNPRATRAVPILRHKVA